MNAAFLDVRTGYIYFDGVDRRIVEAFGDGCVILDGGATDIGDEAGFGKIELGQDFVDDDVHSRVL